AAFPMPGARLAKYTGCSTPSDGFSLWNTDVPLSECALVAGPPDADLETTRRRLPSQPRDQDADRGCGFPVRAHRHRIYGWSETDDLHVRRQRPASLKPDNV